MIFENIYQWSRYSVVPVRVPSFPKGGNTYHRVHCMQSHGIECRESTTLRKYLGYQQMAVLYKTRAHRYDRSIDVRRDEQQWVDNERYGQMAVNGNKRDFSPFKEGIFDVCLRGRKSLPFIIIDVVPAHSNAVNPIQVWSLREHHQPIMIKCNWNYPGLMSCQMLAVRICNCGWKRRLNDAGRQMLNSLFVIKTLLLCFCSADCQQ